MAVTSSFFVVGLNIALSAALLHVLGARGLLLANGIAMFVGTGFLIVILWRLTDGLDWKSLLSSLSRISLASAAMALALLWIRSLGYVPAATLASRAWYLTGLLAIGAVLYLGVSRALGVEELTIVFRTIMQKFTGRVAGSQGGEGV